MRARVEAVLLPVLVVLLIGAVVVAVLRRGDGPLSLESSFLEATPAPVYDGTLEPAAAVLPLVPQDAASLTVTDLSRIRQQLGVADLTGADPAAARDDFWTRASQGTALLTGGLLRDDDATLAGGYGFTEDDVDWEAHFFDSGGHELGWVLAFRDDLNMAAVERAVKDGVGPLVGTQVQLDRHLVAKGVTPTPADSWAAVPGAVDLVGPPADSTYLQRGCLPGAITPVPSDTSTPTTAPVALEPLTAYSVAFGAQLATVRLGAPRPDAFTRLALDPQVPDFAEGYAGGVADPSTGRLGYRLVDPVAAADLALRGQLPFAACGQSSTPASG